MLAIGTYKARVIATDTGASSKKGTPFIKLVFQLGTTDGPMPLDHLAYVTENTQDRVVKDLKTLGYAGADPDEFAGGDAARAAALCPNEVEIVIEHEADQQGSLRERVKWINAIGGGGGPAVPGMFAGLKAAFAAAGKGAVKAVVRTGPVQPIARPAAPQEEDQPPFLSDNAPPSGPLYLQR